MWQQLSCHIIATDIYFKGTTLQRFYSSLLIITLLLTFVGQAVASVAMFCEMPHEGAKTFAHVKMDMPQSDSQIHENMSHKMIAMDCCDNESTPKKECKCPMSGCAANSMLNVESLFSVTLLGSEKVSISVPSTQITIPRSLYRPPMFA
ncbi:hypothetical protein [Pseudoalteromonas sp. H103]|uniref:hypothetical protein n=1 Tax=Pseudoalteromonas sp. H103 TaxID=1761893 RepID=UPI000AE82446